MTNRILTAKMPYPELAIEIGKVSAQYPDKLQPSVAEAYQAAEKGDFEKAGELCLTLLDCGAVPEIRALLGICCFMQGEAQKAETIFSELTRDFPEKEDYHIYHGTMNHALGRYEEVVRELGRLYPLDTYIPFYYTCYGDSLQQLGRLKQSREAFHEEAAHFEKTGEIASENALDGAFENLLYLDITLGNGKYQEDVKLYYEFLDQTEMTSEMQENLAGNIVYFCSLMRNKWYRPLFLEFITHISEKGFLTDSGPQETLRSAFTSWESYEYHEDREISALMEAWLVASHDRKYAGEAAPDDAKVLALTYEWYMCRYAQDHPDKIAYVKEKYPYTYAEIREFLEKAEADRDGVSKQLRDELHKYTSGVSMQDFEESLKRAYRKACEDKKEPAYVYDGMETYRRIQPKAGRNDPCPCGSGKKYKKCCGR